ncbi:hypothetical protein GQX74_001191 [Glossina fuscipes]|nr:hypothetical protein GQX74_001191 [Glossina fuscipes]
MSANLPYSSKIEGIHGIGRKQACWLRNVRQWTGIKNLGHMSAAARDSGGFSVKETSNRLIGKALLGEHFAGGNDGGGGGSGGGGGGSGGSRRVVGGVGNMRVQVTDCIVKFVKCSRSGRTMLIKSSISIYSDCMNIHIMSGRRPKCYWYALGLRWQSQGVIYLMFGGYSFSIYICHFDVCLPAITYPLTLMADTMFWRLISNSRRL